MGFVNTESVGVQLKLFLLRLGDGVHPVTQLASDSSKPLQSLDSFLRHKSSASLSTPKGEPQAAKSADVLLSAEREML